MTAYNTWKTRFDESATFLPSLNKLPVKDCMVKEAGASYRMMESVVGERRTALPPGRRP